MTEVIKAYLFSVEAKDKFCLEPIQDALSDHLETVYSVSIDNICNNIEQFSVENCPVAVFSSLIAYDFAKFIRGGRPFIAIGLEHGVAPFKRYTYNQRFIEYDCYISPTKMWSKRLRDLHPRYAIKFNEVAYPRIDDLRSRSIINHNIHPAWQGLDKQDRSLVVMSWGIDFEAIKKMPDRKGIVYLVHPSKLTAQAANQTILQNAKIVVSQPDEASALIDQAGRVFGDFSSMTLEASVLNEQTFMFIDRDFYTSDCDLSSQFFDRSGEGFGKIDHTDFSLQQDHVLDMKGLSEALEDCSFVSVDPIRAWAPEGLLPEMTGDQSARAADVISQVTKRLWAEKSALGSMSPNLVALKVVKGAYREVLGREPDYPAAYNHARNWLSDASHRPAKTLSLYNSFAHSAEGKKRWGANNFNLPQLKIEPMSGETKKL